MTAAFLISGCATSNNPADPLEGFNRAMFSFNDKVDQVALKPAATAYRKTLPDVVQAGVSNFFGNLGDVWTAVNNLLQGKVEEGMSDVGRVMLNTLVGLGGVFDVASEANLPKHHEDFGQTLGKWGIGSGPYVVLPILGPSTVRDTAALPVDWMGDPWVHVDPVRARNTGIAVRAVDQRANVLDASSLIEDAALDKYEFIRDAYLQRRQSLVHENGSLPSDQDKEGATLDDWETVESTTGKTAGKLSVAPRVNQVMAAPGALGSDASAKPETSSGPGPAR